MKKLIAFVGIVLSAAAFTASAQTADRSDQAERSLTIGDVFEIIAIPDESATFGWVLTKENQFIEAGRDNVFRTRLTQPGKYRLDGSMRTINGESRLLMEITAKPLTGLPDAPPDTADIAEITGGSETDILNPLMSIRPAGWVQGVIGVDTDTAKDSDGNGILTDDQDLGDSLFATEHNTIHLWFSENPPHRIALATTAADGTMVTQVAGIGDATIPTIADTIEAGDEQRGLVRFVIPIDVAISPEDLVFYWVFGDGATSFADTPTHRYKANGEYTVSVTVRELATAEIIAQGETSVVIENATIVEPPSSAGGTVQSSKPASSKPAENTGATRTSDAVMLIVKLTVILLLAIVIGVAAVWAGRKFLGRESRLQKTLADAEAMLVSPAGKTEEAALETAAPPMTLRKAASSAPETSMEEAVPAEVATEPAEVIAPVVTEAAAPAWLQQGLEMAKDQQLPGAPVQDETPPVAPETPAPTGETTPAPETAPAPAEDAQQTEEESLPPWLQEGNSDAAETIGEPAVEPTVTEPSITNPAPPPPWLAPAPAVTETPLETAAEQKTAEPTVEPPAPVATEPAVTPESPVNPPVQEATPPAPAPAPEIITAAPAPVAPVAAEPAPEPTPAPAPTPVAAAPTADADAVARAERERERKRKKRQRYRENLRKRETAGKTENPGAAQKTPIPTTTVAPAPAASPKAPVAAAPVAQDIPLQEKKTDSPAPVVPDDQVAFIVKAENISTDAPKKDTSV